MHQVLEIPSTDQLCKTLIMENVKLNHVDEEAAKKRLRYVAVVVQYGQRLHKEKLVGSWGSSYVRV